MSQQAVTAWHSPPAFAVPSHARLHSTVASSPDTSNSHPLLLHHTHCQLFVLLQRGRPDQVTAKGTNPLILTRRCQAPFSTLPPRRAQAPPCRKPEWFLCRGKGDGNGIISPGRASLPLSAAVPAPVPPSAAEELPPLRCPLPTGREASAERGAPIQRSSELQTLPSALHPFLHLPSPPALQKDLGLS